MRRKAPVELKQAVEKGAEEAHQQAHNPGGRVKESIQSNPPSLSWGSLAKWLGGIGAVGGVILHLMGYISHQAYLEAWGIDHGLFPKPTDATVINGYYAFVERTITFLSAIKQMANYLFWAIPALTLYLFIILRFSKPSRNYKVRNKTQRSGGWVGDLFKSLAVTISTLAGIPIALFFAVFVLAVPVILGQNVGQSNAKNEMVLFREGCDAQPSGRRCIDLRKDGETLARGFPIDSSESHIALFDVDEKRARALEREGTELLVDPVRSTPNTGKN